MEQIFIIESFVKSVILKIEPPVKDEYELALEAEAKRKREEAEALALLNAKGKKGKKAKKPKKPKKGKKGKTPAGPSEEELKFMQSCSMQMSCLPIFDFYLAHDNFIPPPPPEPVGKKGKKKKKPKKKKKGKEPPRKIMLPSEPLPQPPFVGVGYTEIFLSRPAKLQELFESTPLNVSVWNRDEELNCIGFVKITWDESFINLLKRSAEANPMDMYVGELRDTSTPEIMCNTVELIRPLRCEEDLQPSGQIDIFIRLTCLGNRLITYFIALPEMDRLPGRKYLTDELKLKDMEVVRHWEGTKIEEVPPVSYFFGALDLARCADKVPEQEVKPFSDFKAPFTQDELVILSMGFPKGPCGGTNCLKRLEFRGSQHQFIYGQKIQKKYKHGVFVNKRDVHGPCGRLDCPLAKKVREFICNEGTYKSCKKPCTKDFY